MYVFAGYGFYFNSTTGSGKLRHAVAKKAGHEAHPRMGPCAVKDYHRRAQAHSNGARVLAVINRCGTRHPVAAKQVRQEAHPRMWRCAVKGDHSTHRLTRMLPESEQ